MIVRPECRSAYDEDEVRRTETGQQEVIRSWECIKAAIPAGFEIDMLGSHGFWDFRLSILGPRTKTHPHGAMFWRHEVDRDGELTEGILGDLRDACKAWSKEAVLADEGAPA